MKTYPPCFPSFMRADLRPGALLLAFAALAFPAFADEPAPVAPAADKPAPAAEEPHAAPAKEAEALQGRLTLGDGSVLSGTLRSRFVSAVSDTVGPFRLDLSAVESIDFSRQDGRGAQKPQAPACRVTFRNGDRLTARLSPEKGVFALETLLGPLSVPIGSVASLVMEGQPSDALLYYCTFDNEAAITHPAAGPKGTFLGGEFVPGKVGNALYVMAGTHAVEVKFPVGLMQPQGTIEFWAKIPGVTRESRYSEGGNPQFFTMSVGKWINTFVKYTANDGFGTGGLHADMPGSAYVSSLPSWSSSACYPDFLGDPAAWHHYALVWSEDGLEAESKTLGRRVVSALYVDGRLMNPSFGTNSPDRAYAFQSFVRDSIVLGFPVIPSRQDANGSRVDYLIDEFKIWSKAKSEFKRR